LEGNTIEATHAIITTVGSQSITGIAKIGGRLVILLDMTKVLTSEEKHQTALLQAQAQKFLQ